MIRLVKPFDFIHPMKKSDFPIRLKHFRCVSDLSQRELALSIGITPIQVSRYEVSGSTPKDETFKKILEVLKVSQDVFWNTEVTQHELTSDFSNRFKYLRSKLDLSQEDLAIKIGVSTKQVSDYEVSRSLPRQSTFIKILKVFNLTEVEFWEFDVPDFIDGMEQDNFSSRLHFFRKKMGITQAKFALKVGVSTKQISDYEVGTSKPRQATLNKILDILGMDDKAFWTIDIKDPNNQNGVFSSMNHSGMSDDDVKEISQRVGLTLAEKMGIDPSMATAIIAVELKGSIFGLSNKQRQDISDENLKKIEEMASDQKQIDGSYKEV